MVAAFDPFSGESEGHSLTPSGTLNKERHKWLKCWFAKGILSSISDPEEFNYYKTDSLSDDQKEIIKNAYKFLWGEDEASKLTNLDSASENMKLFTKAIFDAHAEDYSLRASNLTVFPDSEQFSTFLAALSQVGEFEGIDYSTLYSRYHGALANAIADIIKLFSRTNPYSEDGLLSKITVRDTRLHNIDLYTGTLASLSTRIESDDIPELSGDINPAGTLGLVANTGNGSLLPITVDGGIGSNVGDLIDLSGTPRAIAFDPTGRFAYVSLANGGVEWVDITPNEMIGDPKKGSLEGTVSDIDPLIVTNDGSRLYAGGISKVGVFDLSKREFMENGAQFSVGGKCRDMAIGLSGEKLYITTYTDKAEEGELVEIDIAQKNPKNYVPPSVINSHSLPGKIRGVAVSPWDGDVYVTTDGKYNDADIILHSLKSLPAVAEKWAREHYDPLYIGGEPPVATTIEESGYTQIIHTDVLHCSFVQVSAFLDIIENINIPSWVVMVIVDASPYESWIGIAPFLNSLWMNFLNHHILSPTSTIIVFYKVNPVGLYKGIDIVIPPVSYPGCSSLAFEAFGLSANIGLFDLEESKFLAASPNQAGLLTASSYEQNLMDVLPGLQDLPGGTLYFPMHRIASSQLGDTVGVHPGWDAVSFGAGKKLFKAPNNPPAKGFKEEPIDVFLAGNPLAGLDQPRDVAIQPIVYVYWPPVGQEIEGEQFEYLIFSRLPISNISANGGSLNWTATNDRFYSGIVQDGTYGPLSFDITLNNGATIKIGGGVTGLAPEFEPVPTPIPTPIECEVELNSVYSDQIPGRECNALPGQNPMYMGTHEDGRGYLQIDATVQPQQINNVGIVGVRHSSSILDSAPIQIPRTLLDFDPAGGRELYEIVAGCDLNSDEILQNSEVSEVIIEQCMLISQGDYNHSDNILTALTIITIGVGSQLLEAFIDDTIPPNVINTATSIASTDLTHPVGASWDPSCLAQTRLYTYVEGTDASDDVEEDPHLIAALQASLGQHKAEVQSYFTQHTTVNDHTFAPWNWQANGLLFNGWALHLAFGHVNVVGTVSVTVMRTSLSVTHISYTGSFDDIYDFDYIGAYPSVHGATMQIGFPTLGVGGRVFRNHLEFSRGTTNFNYNFN